MSGRIFDISPVVSQRIGVFPGDVPFQRNVSYDFAKGDHLVLSSITTTLHVGAHADGPNHYSLKGAGIHERDLSIYMGNCVVLHAEAERGARIGAKHLTRDWQEKLESGRKWPATRVLVRTHSFPDPDRWNSDFNSFEPELIEKLAGLGVRLIGIDTPSIDPEDAKELVSHQAVAKHDMAILEGLVLNEIPEGIYTLIALPLNFEGADAAPVRAVLIEGSERLEGLIPA